MTNKTFARGAVVLLILLAAASVAGDGDRGIIRPNQLRSLAVQTARRGNEQRSSQAGDRLPPHVQSPDSLVGRLPSGLAPVVMLTLQAASPSSYHVVQAAPTSAVPEGQSRDARHRQTPIPLEQLGAAATSQYAGDELAVSATPAGARLYSVFQKLEADATVEGLWITSSAGRGGHLRLIADTLRRHDISTALAAVGTVAGANDVATFTRPGLITAVAAFTTLAVPTITNIADQTITEDGAAALAFTISDADTSVGSLTVSGSSSNTTLVPNENANIAFISVAQGNAGLKFTPTAN